MSFGGLSPIEVKEESARRIERDTGASIRQRRSYSAGNLKSILESPQLEKSTKVKKLHVDQLDNLLDMKTLG